MPVPEPTLVPTPAPTPEPTPVPTPAPTTTPRGNKQDSTLDPGPAAIGLFVTLVVLAFSGVAATIYFFGQPRRQATFQLGNRYFLNEDGTISQDRGTALLPDHDLEAVDGQTEAVDQRFVTLREQDHGTVGMRQAHL